MRLFDATKCHCVINFFPIKVNVTSNNLLFAKNGGKKELEVIIFLFFLTEKFQVLAKLYFLIFSLCLISDVNETA